MRRPRPITAEPVTADYALGLHLHAQIAAFPGQIRGADLPSEVAARLRDATPRTHLPERARFTWRFLRRHGAAVARAPIN